MDQELLAGQGLDDATGEVGMPAQLTEPPLILQGLLPLSWL